MEKENKPREVALRNLKSSSLMNIATSYLVDKNKGAYGEAGNSAMEQFKYFPAFNSGAKAYSPEGEEYDLIKNSILSSREDGERYSGNISEKKIMKDCFAIMQESLNALTISDILELMGSKAEIPEKYKNMYVKDLVPKISKEDMANLSNEEEKKIKNSAELYQNLIESYQSYISQKMVSESLGESAKQIPKSLEKILIEGDKK